MDTSKWKVVAGTEYGTLLIDMQEPNPQKGWEADSMGRILNPEAKTITVPVSVGLALKWGAYWNEDDAEDFGPVDGFIKGAKEVDMNGKPTGVTF